MKTKLATLLIAPALLFTACGAKEISVKEAFQYAQEHFTQRVKKGAKANVTWNLKDSNEFGKTSLAEMVKDQLMLEIDPTQVTGSKDQDVENVHQFIVGKEDPFEDFTEEIRAYCPFNTKFYLPNNNLSIKGDLCMGEGDVFLTIHMSSTYDEKGYAKEVIAECEKFSGEVEFGGKKQTVVMAGIVTATFTLNA